MCQESFFLLEIVDRPLLALGSFVPSMKSIAWSYSFRNGILSDLCFENTFPYSCNHSSTWAFQVFVSSQSESLYWSRLLSMVAIIIVYWWLPRSVVSAQLRMWLSGSSSLMLSNKRNPLTSILRWSSLASASTSCVLQTLLAYVSGHLVTSH